ncbi:MAG: hydantoinase/oxoprolinase family protein, partial [Pseudomonadota bacterium]|nr:hydantoinase/oxoprolinase family protein [Pseudomonadota bacterium]
MSYVLGCDVGGTFTDLLLINEKTGKTYRAKTPSTPADQSVGVMNGINRICSDAGIKPSEINELMHGTTVATNSILEGKGANVGLIVTEGYRQVLQIGRSFVPGGLAGWIIWPKPKPLAHLENTVEVKERTGARGDIVRPLDEESVLKACELLKSQGVDAVTVSLMNSFSNGKHEKKIRKILENELPGVPVSLSHEVLPEMYEYERTLTAVANSFVRPTVSKYLKNLENALIQKTGGCKYKVLRSDGGLMSFSNASDHPVSLMMSGPAGGVAGAVWVSKQAGFQNLLTFDMGGTSTDVALIENGEPQLRRETKVGDVTVRASSLDVRTVGAGGGSIANVPELTGALRVGPESAGADPGPASYGMGGESAAVTDANVVLGHLPPSLIGGEMKLDVKAARTAIKKAVADPLKISVEAAAEGIIKIVNENMFGALRLVSIEQGYDPRDFALIGFGGAGPLHANALGKLTGSWPVIIPPGPGVLCAYGDATTRVRNEASQTYVRRYSETDNKEIASLLNKLTKSAAESLIKEGIPKKEHEVRWEIDIRYSGQAFALTVPCEVKNFDKNGLELAASVFDSIHTRMFTFALDAEHEVVNIRAVVLGNAPKVKAVKTPKGSGGLSAAVIDSKHSIWSEGKKLKAKIYDRSLLKAGQKIIGPAVVTEFDSTTVILPDCVGEVDNYGSILITPRGWKGNKKSGVQSKPKTKAKAKAKPKTKAKAKPKTKAKAKPKTKAKAKPKTKAKSKPKTKAKTKQKTKSKDKTKTKA